MGADAAPAVDFHDVTVAYGRRPVLWNIDLAVHAPGLFGIIGPNGAGKSTLVKAALGLVPLAGGSVRLFGRPLAEVRVVKHAWNPGCVGFDVRWIRNGRGGWSGTSANLALKIGLALDYTRFVLAGCPMDNSGNWYKPLIGENDIKANKDHRHHLWKWTEIAGRPIGRFVRSMSGKTAELFGRPIREWLCHEPEIEQEIDYGRPN